MFSKIQIQVNTKWLGESNHGAFFLARLQDKMVVKRGDNKVLIVDKEELPQLSPYSLESRRAVSFHVGIVWDT